MGGTIHNDQRPYQLTANAGFVRIIDRPMGAAANTYSFEYAGLSSRQTLTKAQDNSLVSSAAVGFGAFSTAASNILIDWGTMNPSQKAEAWQLYRLVDVRRWAEVHQDTPFVHIPSSDITAGQDAALSSAAKHGRTDFDIAATAVFGNWYSNLATADQDGFFSNYQEA